MEIIWPPWRKIINDSFYPLVANKDRFLILWGGRGSSKSDFAAKKLIARCISEKYFRYLLVRRNYNSVKNSQWQTIKDLIFDMGLESLFTFNLQPLEIKCIANGNKFIAAGCDDPTKLKSTKDPTGAWYEEDIIEESDWITITTSIRTQKADYLQEIFTINPEVEGNFEDNWFWQRFFKGHAEVNFRNNVVIKLEGREVYLPYTSHHSTWHDNRWLPDEFKAFLEDLKNTNPYYYTIYTLGQWGNKVTGGRAYKGFDRSKHLSLTGYYESLPLHVSFDFNVKPYMSMSIYQAVEKEVIKIDEIAAKEPDNTTKGICRLFCQKYPNHESGLFVYGDPSGKQKDTRQEKGYNDYNIIAKELSAYSPKFRVADVAPPVVQRINFFNAVFDSNIQGITFLVNEKCVYSIMDFVYLKENADGTKFKEKFKDETGVICERYGHFTDTDDYFITVFFRSEFNSYLRGNRKREYLSGDPRSNFEY